MTDFENYESDLLSHIDRGLKFGQSIGADHLELFLIKQHQLQVTNISSILKTMNGGNIGVGCRCTIGKKVGFAAASGINDEAVNFSIKNALKNANINQVDERWHSFVSSKEKGKDGDLDYSIVNLTPDIVVREASQIYQEARKADSRISSVMAGVNSDYGTYAVGNTEGIEKATSSTGLSGFVSVSANDNGKIRTSDTSLMGRKLHDFSGLGKKGADKALELFNARPLGTTSLQNVVFNPTSASLYLQSSLYNSINGKSIVEGRSIFKERINERIGAQILSIYDDGQLSIDPNMHAIDHEGVPRQKSCIIENGILKSFIFDQYYGLIHGKKSTGNGFRRASQVYEALPSVSLSTITISQGNKALDDLLNEVENGIFIVDSVIGIHTSNFISGDFSFGSASCYKIEHGEIAYPLEAITVSGNFYESFKNVIGIGNDMELTAGSYLPSMAYEGFTVTG